MAKTTALYKGNTMKSTGFLKIKTYRLNFVPYRKQMVGIKGNCLGFRKCLYLLTPFLDFMLRLRALPATNTLTRFHIKED